MLDRAVDILFPRACAGCGAGSWPFCERCADALVPLQPPWCRRCGRPAPTEVDSCRDCPPAPIDSARSAFVYRGPARDAVHRLKFSGWRGVGEALAAAVAALGPPPAGAGSGVARARRRRAERGFDQARVLARALARELDLPAVALIRRRTATTPQSRRTREERLRAMHGAFASASRRPAPARVLLVDDVLTTGATVSACAAVLSEAGVREIHVVTACRSFSDRRSGADRPPGPRGSRHP